MTDTSPKVSVVCAWYNRADYIHETINSLLTQDYPNFDITVINDGSPDPRVREIFDTYDEPRLRVIHQGNTGFTRAIRRAIDESEGKYIAVQGAGDVSLPRRLSKQVELFESHESIVIAGCWLYEERIDENGTLLDHVIRKHALNKVSKTEFRKANPLSHGETMYMRSCYTKTGGYRDEFRKAQDVDLWLRMLDFGEIFIKQEVLYTRRNFLLDGTSSNGKSTAIAQRYSDLALECDQQRCSGKIDIVNKFGNECMIFSKRSRKFTRFMTASAAKSILNGERERALTILSYIGGNEMLAHRLLLRVIAKSNLLCKAFYIVFRRKSRDFSDELKEWI
jgi:glycosyltransferase involved in cell wall biosynthesis